MHTSVSKDSVLRCVLCAALKRFAMLCDWVGRLDNVDLRTTALKVWLHTLCGIDLAVGIVLFWRSLTAAGSKTRRAAQSPRCGYLFFIELKPRNKQDCEGAVEIDSQYYESSACVTVIY
jgi:hypothetical protein